LLPTTTSPGLAPSGTRRHARSGSAHRLSQPPSGFLARPSFAALFRAAAIPGMLPFRGFPSRRSRTSLEAASSLAVIHQRFETNPSRPCQRRFHRHPRSRAAAWIPRRLWAPFPHAEARFPVPLGLKRYHRLIPPASPTSKPYSLRESVRTSLRGPKPAVDPLLGFFPSRAFSVHASDLQTRQTPGAWRSLRPEGQSSRLKGPLDPSSQVDRLATSSTEAACQQPPTPFEVGPHRPATAPLLP
jgi:hypothetical protein